MTTRLAHRLRLIALRTLRRTALIGQQPHRRLVPHRQRTNCAPPCGQRLFTVVPDPRTPEDR
ncbi:hypothetical protein [Streptomyces sp. MW-W600-10]|uniref:hypothetical protein n=1 Tax=Streptomyces sp. MW-W600-10 TaxID=2829819 RepID=UPI001C46F0C7|nr:hypothetical protein [Streptomyces sp. MW-W600-10]MBV7249209.1 hypothetical protein [Streptomyces sp. MW-W600-10]